MNVHKNARLTRVPRLALTCGHPCVYRASRAMGMELPDNRLREG